MDIKNKHKGGKKNLDSIGKFKIKKWKGGSC